MNALVPVCSCIFVSQENLIWTSNNVFKKGKKKRKKEMLEQGDSSNLSYLCTVIMFRPLLAICSNVKDFEESLQ